jgi:hypothetical protein
MGQKRSRGTCADGPPQLKVLRMNRPFPLGGFGKTNSLDRERGGALEIALRFSTSGRG